jgi:hypothetical protein
MLAAAAIMPAWSGSRECLKLPCSHCLQGLAAGFVLLRFEALVEEGKLDDVLK